MIKLAASVLVALIASRILLQNPWLVLIVVLIVWLLISLVRGKRR